MFKEVENQGIPRLQVLILFEENARDVIQNSYLGVIIMLLLLSQNAC
jgi:hypothetical protein